MFGKKNGLWVLLTRDAQDMKERKNEWMEVKRLRQRQSRIEANGTPKYVYSQVNTNKSFLGKAKQRHDKKINS